MDDISILNLELGLNSVTLEKPFLRIVRGRDGSLNWMHYFASGDAGKAGEAMSGNSTEPVATKAANATVDAVADETGRQRDHCRPRTGMRLRRRL
jgi:hypothetical protein